MKSIVPNMYVYTYYNNLCNFYECIIYFYNKLFKTHTLSTHITYILCISFVKSKIIKRNLFKGFYRLRIWPLLSLNWFNSSSSCYSYFFRLWHQLGLPLKRPGPRLSNKGNKNKQEQKLSIRT